MAPRGSGMLVKVNLDRLPLEPGHTPPDLCNDKRRPTEVCPRPAPPREWCIPSTPRVSSRVGIYWGGIVYYHVGRYHNSITHTEMQSVYSMTPVDRAIKLTVSFLFVCFRQISLTHDSNNRYSRSGVDLGVMAMKGYSTLPRTTHSFLAEEMSVYPKLRWQRVPLVWRRK